MSANPDKSLLIKVGIFLLVLGIITSFITIYFYGLHSTRVPLGLMYGMIFPLMFGLISLISAFFPRRN